MINNITIAKILLILIILFLCISPLLSNEMCATEDMVNISPLNKDVKWKRSQCGYYMEKTIKNVLDNNNFKEDNSNSNLYLPCSYNDMVKEVDMISPKNNNDRIFLIDNADEISSKNNIWINLREKYGRDKASQMMPKTYVLYNNHDIELLKKEFELGKIYILKKNIQRQEGLKITNDLNYMINGYKDGYVVAQELLQNPYIINGRKINMRFYLLVVCLNGQIGAYVHRNGFMYYTKDLFKVNSLDEGPNITTGYIDRKVYEVNPLTLEDLRVYLDDSNRKLTEFEANIKHKNVLSELVFNRIHKLIADAVASMDYKLCQQTKFKKNVTFQLFGVDIALSNQLIPQIMEVNKGPDLGAKDKRDSAVKHKVVEDMFKTIKVLDDNDNEFIPIL